MEAKLPSQIAIDPHVVTMHMPQPVAGHAAAQPPAAAFPRHMLTSAAHAVRDGFGQVPSKLTGLAMYTLAAAAVSHADVTAVAAAATLIGGISAATMAGKIAMHQFGTDTVAGKAATALSAVAGGGLGMSFASGDVLAAGSAAAAGLYAMLLMSVLRYAAHRSGKDVAPMAKAAVALSAAGLGAVGYIAGGFVLAGAQTPPHHLAEPAGPQFLARQLGAVFESILVETFKTVLTNVGPSVDAQGLPLEGRMLALTLGLPFFTGTAIGINAVLGSSLLPQEDGAGGAVNFDDLAPAVALSCLVNLVRGGVNVAAVILLWHRLRREEVPENPYAHVAKPKTTGQRLITLADRSAVRLVLILARNAIYCHLRESGHSLEESAIVAQSLYTIFAQYRDVFADLMAGKGWTSAPATGGGVTPAGGAAVPSDGPADASADEAPAQGAEFIAEYSQRVSESSNASSLLKELRAQEPDVPAPPDLNPPDWEEVDPAELEAIYQGTLFEMPSPSPQSGPEPGTDMQPLLAQLQHR